MSFTSTASVKMLQSVPDVFESLSTDEQFQALVRLSPSTHSIEITGKDQVLLPARSIQYLEQSNRVNESSTDELVSRIHFKLMEKVTYVGIPVKLTVMGTQIISPNQKLHIYESTVNRGTVKIHKVRRFVPGSTEETSTDSSTTIEETIQGQTNWLISGFVGREARKAHAAHVARYQELMLPG